MMMKMELAVIYLLPILLSLLIIWGVTKIAQRRSERAVRIVLWVALTALLTTWFPCLLSFKISMVKQYTERDRWLDELISLSVKNIASGRSQVLQDIFSSYLSNIQDDHEEARLGSMNHERLMLCLIQDLRESTNHASQAIGAPAPQPGR
ncbi:MAG: hypothetical protein EOM62_13905 [Bacteroidia bacterium]|nr:hypothetical protein [Bacteroidia bacterium]